MAFRVSVYLPEHLPLINQVPENPEEMNEWVGDCAKLCLFDAPPDSDGLVVDLIGRESRKKINLPLVGPVDGEGFETRPHGNAIGGRCFLGRAL